MSNPSSDGSNSPKHSSSSSESASSDHPPSPPPRLVHPPLPFPIHPLTPQVFIPKEVAPFNWSDEEEENSKELRLKAEENTKEAATTVFMAAPIRHKRRQRLSQSSSKSSASGLFDSKESDSYNNPSKGFSEGSPDDSDLRDGEGKEEEEEEEDDDDDEEEMEYSALDYPQKDSGDDTNAYTSWSPWVARH